MKKSFGKKQKKSGIFTELILSSVIFIIVFVLFCTGIASVGQTASEQQLANVRRAVTQSVVHCYAVEGRYPESIEYLEQNYGLNINRDKYLIHYTVFASNIMPEISVTEKQA